MLILTREAADAQVVVAHQTTQRDIIADRSQLQWERIADRAADCAAILELVFLVAMHGIDEEMREIIE